jgi:hypothetical protein
LLLLPITKVGLLREYTNLLAASLIAMGHHSYYDVIQVAKNLKIFHSRNTRVNSETVTASIDPKDIYNSCLTFEFKTSFAYKKLVDKYPEYLTNVTNSQNITYSL